MTASCRRNEANRIPFIGLEETFPEQQTNQHTNKQMLCTTQNRSNHFGPLFRWEDGQGMVEYAFILALVSLVIVVMLITTGSQVLSMYSDITYTLHNQAGL